MCITQVDIVEESSDISKRNKERQRILTGGKVNSTHIDEYSLINSSLKNVNEFSHIEMTRKIGEDGVAEEEYNFNSEVTLDQQVSY